MSCRHHSHAFSPDCQSGRWKPLELLAMVLGFVFFWPIGLAIVFWKVWQKKSGYSDDLFAFVREQAEGVRRGWTMEGAGFAQTARATGNSAFDEWREAELARLEEERRKLAEAERAFAGHIEELRRARDREEFDSFMRKRNA